MLASLTDQKKISRGLFLGHGSFIMDEWKLVKANSGNEKMKHTDDVLYNIVKDPTEKNNVRKEHPDKYKELLELVKPYDNIESSLVVPPYGQGRKTFKAPKEWSIEK
ncbi:hypothetical protein [Niabella ginsengisoli]|uniref:Uncharacterized protein n=1 Tax=Niabella ginsengisoli TaxID=522298 RepID=A0ABS9SKT4_9BACT|nr:hypothetical protein [Niabella ginsengisoli]MCH5598992.1 hypothetical protein [Niabella ginsengisoli]